MSKDDELHAAEEAMYRKLYALKEMSTKKGVS
jgi:hypothetical protein